MSFELGALRTGTAEWAIAVLSGPNLSTALTAIGLDDLLNGWAGDLGVTVEHVKSNHEGELLDFVHRSAPATNGYLVNPGGLATVGESLRHCLRDARRPSVEVHLDNTELTSASVFAPSVTGIFSGLRQFSYLGALVSLVLALDDPGFLHPDGESATGTPRSLYQ